MAGSFKGVLSHAATQQFLKFFLVGLLAFSIDAIILQALVTFADWNPYTARIPSASTSIIFSWLVNRRFTFTQPKKVRVARSIVNHLFATSFSLAVNLFLYWGFLSTFPSLNHLPVVALSFGAAVGLFINFLLAKYWVFK
jgi:putative flippase GtrA